MQRCSLITLDAHHLTSQCAFNFSTCSGILRLAPAAPHFGKSVRDMIPPSSPTSTPVDRCGTRPSVLRLAASPGRHGLTLIRYTVASDQGVGGGCSRHPRTREGYTEHRSQRRRVEQAKKLPARAFRFHGGPGRRSGAQRLTRRSYRVRPGQDDF